MIKNSQVMKYFLCRFIREKITVEGIAEKWGRVLYFSAIIAAVNVNIHKPNRKFLRRLDDRGLFRLNWSPRDEDLSVDKIEENVNLNFKADFFYTKLLFLAKNVQILNIRSIWLVVCWTTCLLNCLYLHLSLNCRNIKITLNESDKITYKCNRLVCYFDFIHRSNSAR